MPVPVRGAKKSRFQSVLPQGDSPLAARPRTRSVSLSQGEADDDEGDGDSGDGGDEGDDVDEDLGDDKEDEDAADEDDEDTVTLSKNLMYPRLRLFLDVIDVQIQAWFTPFRCMAFLGSVAAAPRARPIACVCSCR